MPDILPPKRFLRFSLLNLMFAMTIAALGVGFFASARRNANLHALNEVLVSENLRHRNELGIFDVTEPEQIHAIRAPTEGGEPRKYRVYLPPGRNYAIHYSVNNIPEKGVTSSHESNSTLAPGHYLISLKLTRDTDRKTGEPVPYGNVDLDVKSTDGIPFTSRKFSIGISERNNDWLLNKATGNTAYSWQEIGRNLQTFSAGEVVVLYRARAQTSVVIARRPDGKPASWSSQSIVGDCDGFMAWIEPISKKETN